MQLGAGGTSGSLVGDVLNNGTLIFNRSDVLTYDGAVSGTGGLTQAGSGTMILTGANSYTGATDVAQGTLRAGGPNIFSTASTHLITPGATLDSAGFNQQLVALSNGGRVSLAGTNAGSTLTVNGPYSGNAGTLVLGTGLVSGASVSDRLILDGPSAQASGRTTIQISNLGGLGALTSGNGIEMIGARNGATTTAQTTRDAFSLAGGHVDAGAYEYRLFAANADGTGENWYLRSTVVDIPTDGSSGGEEGQPAQPGQTPTYCTEVPLITALPAQIRQENLAMLGNLHQRMGDEDPSASRTAKASGTPADDLREAWVRMVYADLDIDGAGTAQAQSNGHAVGLQMGADLWADANWHAGVYVGYLDGSANISGNASGQQGRVGKNDMNSNYLGAYATWRDNQGLYVDSVLQGGRHDYEIKPDNNPNQSGDATSYAASVEIGKAYPLNDQWSLEPQAQLVYQHSEFDDVNLSGARVDQDAGNGWLTRVGVRVKGDLVVDKVGHVQPYGRVNVYHMSIDDDQSRFVGPAGSTDIDNRGGYTSGELAAGGTVGLTSTMDVYGEVGHVWDISGDTRVASDVQASVGVRVRW